jgi:DNA-binding MarR family transcriptional regulator
VELVYSRFTNNPAMDQITAMRVFARVVEAGTFTRAADSLQMPKPTVTKLVQQLETRLRVKLLQRTTRRVTVTPEGAATTNAPRACWPSWKTSSRT